MILRMKTALLTALLLAPLAALHAADDDLLTLQIRFHLTQGATMTVNGQEMEVWVQPDDLRDVVMAEVNRIWKQAKIQFVIERIREEPLLAPANRDALLKSVGNARRGDDESAESGRTANIAKLLDPAGRHPSAHNVYVLPYIGSTYQGYARLGGHQVVVGVWTDKPSKGAKPPVKTLLVEPEPMKIGSLARTIAHELGHNLGLNHPPKDDTTTGARLMGGRAQGYGLSLEDIAKAREIARRNIAAAKTGKEAENHETISGKSNSLTPQ